MRLSWMIGRPGCSWRKRTPSSLTPDNPRPIRRGPVSIRSPFCPDLVSFLPKRFVAYFSVLRIICSHFAVLHRYLLSSYSSFWRILASFLCLVCPYSATNIPSIFCQRILLYSDVFTECIFRLIRIREYCCAGHISPPDVFPP